ncbi:hypothetical protein [Lacticaseibacillus daqingensis]|uniref:hypothetical protein n=1 Tax=Lacticaseibacillus daqingensis TaxID=2486014 RepID=UPI000F786AA6|nr:hypothetical protein [Lacticaseibacillus daqingensis]
MGKQIFVEGQILEPQTLAFVNFAGHSRIMRATVIRPSRVAVTGGAKLRTPQLVLLPAWVQGKWQVGERWRFAGRLAQNVAVATPETAGDIAANTRERRETLAHYANEWINTHQERHAMKLMAPSTARFVAGHTTAQTWYTRLKLLTGEESPLVIPAHYLSDGLIILARVRNFTTEPGTLLTVVTHATKLSPESLMGETADPAHFQLGEGR